MLMIFNCAHFCFHCSYLTYSSLLKCSFNTYFERLHTILLTCYVTDLIVSQLLRTRDAYWCSSMWMTPASLTDRGTSFDIRSACKPATSGWETNWSTDWHGMVTADWGSTSISTAEISTGPSTLRSSLQTRQTTIGWQSPVTQVSSRQRTMLRALVRGSEGQKTPLGATSNAPMGNLGHEFPED